MRRKILFSSPHCLLDNASGAAMSVSTQLSSLTGLGWSCRSVTGSVFDTEARVNTRAVLLGQGLGEIGAVGPNPVLGGRVNGMEHFVMPFSDSRRSYVTAMDEMALFHLVSQQVDEFKPDFFYLYGGLLLERALIGMAKQKGVKTVFYLANPNYSDLAVFENVALILTPSETLADFYRDKIQIPIKPIGTFTRTDSMIADRSAADCVTFINPTPEKGVTLFLTLAKLLPDIKFLLVESRWTAVKVSEKLNIDWSALPNVEIMPRQKDMRRVYEKTKVLLFPSYWFEASGRVAIEALMNGIPVLASSHGGIGETLAGGGFLLDVPQRCLTDFLSVPTKEEAGQWVEKIRELLDDSTAMNDAVIRALHASEKHSIETKSMNLGGCLEDLCRGFDHA